MSFRPEIISVSVARNGEFRPVENRTPAQTAVTAPQAASVQTHKHGRFSINLVANLAQLALNLAVGFLYVPYLVRKLGDAAYGLIPLTAAVTSYMGRVTYGLNQPVARFLIIELERDDHRRANLVFNTTF